MVCFSVCFLVLAAQHDDSHESGRQDKVTAVKCINMITGTALLNFSTAMLRCSKLST